jgi:hypothetical protein
MGLTLPEAHAIIRSLKVDENGQGVATLAVHINREMAINPRIRPFHEEKVYFTVDRNESPYITAYRQAKTIQKMPTYDMETGLPKEVDVKPFFYGWEDVIEGV